jgi:predicted unusual protein kinase regulating ubiquinone biosynthesis (AarF/ABC1/UbiB family)
MSKIRNKVDVSLPDWTTQLRAIGMSDKSIKDMTFRPGDHDFFIAMNDTFQQAITAEMKILIEDALKAANTGVCKEVTNIVTEHTTQVGETYVNMMRAIEGLDRTVKKIDANMNKLNERQLKTEERITKEEFEIKVIKDRLDRKKERIDRIEKLMTENQLAILEKIGDLEHDTRELAMALDTDTTKANKAYRLKKYIVLILIAIIATTLITFFSLFQHGRNTKKMMEKVKIENPKVFIPKP